MRSYPAGIIYTCGQLRPSRNKTEYHVCVCTYIRVYNTYSIIKLISRACPVDLSVQPVVDVE